MSTTSNETNIKIPQIMFKKKSKELPFRYHIALYKLLRFVSPTGVELFNSNGPMTVVVVFSYPLDTEGNLEKARKFLFDNAKDKIIKDCIDKAVENPDLIYLSKLRCKQELESSLGENENEKLINMLLSFVDFKYTDFLIMGAVPLK